MVKVLVSLEMGIPLKESWDTVSFMEKELLNGQMGLFIKGNSKIMKSPDKAVTNGQTNLGMKALLKTDSEMELENTWTQKKKLNIKENGLMEWDMEKVLLHIKMDQFTRENGNEEWNGVMVKWHIQVRITTKDNGVTTRETGKEQCTGFQVMKSMKEIGKTIFKVDLEHIYGLMEQLKTSFLEIDMLATGNLGRDVDLVLSIIQMAVNMRENGKTIISMARVYLHLKMALNILVHLIRIVWSKERYLWKMFSKQLLKI